MALKLYTGTNSAIKVYASDWRLFIREIKKIDPQQIKELQKRWKEISEPARDSVKSELKTLGSAGPMRGMRHGGRTGWGTNYGKVGSPVSGAKRKTYDNVSSSQLQSNKKGATGIARVRVNSAATTISDLAQKFSGRAYTRMYRIREFGGEEIMRNHILSSKAVNQMLTNLGPVSKSSKLKKSRNVYPGFDKALPSVSAEAKKAIQETIKFVEDNIDRSNRP
jgi:mRNA-degrading endonuclease RelE of RelBE toxin-antitoxin system